MERAEALTAASRVALKTLPALSHITEAYETTALAGRPNSRRQGVTARFHLLREAPGAGRVRYGDLRCVIGNRHCFQSTLLESLGVSDTLHRY